MQKANLFLLSLLLSTVLFFSCTKGDTGPAGATGAKGTANVQYSSWNALNMKLSTVDSSYEQTITADSLTQAVLDSGIVLTYMKYVDPSTRETSVVNADTYMDQIFTAGTINLYSFNDYTGFYYRYVIIPGGFKVGRLASGSAIGYTKQQLQKMSYDEVMKLLGRN